MDKEMKQWKATIDSKSLLFDDIRYANFWIREKIYDTKGSFCFKVSIEETEKEYYKFKPFEKVLVACSDCYNVIRWIPDMYSYYNESCKKHLTIGGHFVTDSQILPYEGNEDKIGKEVNL